MIGKVDRMIYGSIVNVRFDKGYSDLKVVYYIQILKCFLKNILFKIIIIRGKYIYRLNWC